MKKLILTAVLILVSSPFFAQSAFDKFDGQDDVTSIVVNKKMFELMSKVKVDASDKETQQYLSLIKKLDNLKVFTTKSTRVEGEMKVAAEIAIALFKKITFDAFALLIYSSSVMNLCTNTLIN